MLLTPTEFLNRNKLLLIALACWFHAGAQPKPTLIPWHSGYKITKMVFSADGRFLATMGDDAAVVITDLKKRLPIHKIENISETLLESHPGENAFYIIKGSTDSYSADSVEVLKIGFEKGDIQHRVTIHTGIPIKDSFEKLRWAYPAILNIDYTHNTIMIPFESTGLKQIVVFGMDGKIQNKYEIKEATRINTILASKGNIWVSASNGLFKSERMILKQVLTPQGKNNFFANLKSKGDTLVLLSNEQIQWVSANDLRPIRTVNIATLNAQDPSQAATGRIVEFRHPFVLDKNGNCWLADTKLRQLSNDIIKTKAYYLLARVSDKITYPLISNQVDNSSESIPVESLFAFEPRHRLFAIINWRHSSHITIFDIDHKELFEIGRTTFPVKKLFLTNSPGKLFLMSDAYENSSCLMLDLSNGQVEPFGFIEKRKLIQYPSRYRDYADAPGADSLYNENAGLFQPTRVLEYEQNRFITGDSEIDNSHTLTFPTPGGSLVLEKRTGVIQWSDKTGQHRELKLTTREKKPIQFNEFFFEDYTYSTRANMLIVNYGSQQIGGNGLQFAIHLVEKKIINSWEFENAAFFPEQNLYATSRGVFNFTTGESISAFPDDLRPWLYHEQNFVLTSDGRFLCYKDYENQIISFDLANKKASILGQHSNLAQMVSDPHSNKIFTLGQDGTIQLWHPEKGLSVASIVVEAKKEFKRLNEIQPSYLITTPDGMYMGQNRYFGMITLKNGGKEVPFRQMEALFNRPDRVLKSMGYAGAEFITSIESIANQKVSKLTSGTTDAEIEIDNKASLKYYSEEPLIRLSASTTRPVNEGLHVMVYVNGTALWPSPGRAATSSLNFDISLVDPINHIRICLVDKTGAETPGDYVYVNSKPAPSRNLYMIGVGLSNYKNSTYNLKFAVKDMTDLANYVSTVQSYTKTFLYRVMDQMVNNHITDSIKVFLKEARAEDEVFVYFAGHGLLDAKNNFYLSTYAIDFKNPAKDGLPLDDLTSALSVSKARKKILFIDACNSGSQDDATLPGGNQPAEKPTDATSRGAEAEVSNTNVNLSSLYFNFAHSNTSDGLNILAAAGGKEAAMEGGGVNNGYFTYALLTALKTGNSDFNQDGEISVRELFTAASAQVRKLSGGRQSPSFRQSNIYLDIPVVKTDDSYFSNFINAARVGNNYLLKMMIDNKEVNINQKDKDGFTALHYASREGNFLGVQYLITQGAAVNIKTNFGFTPVYLAALNGHDRILYLLMRSGAETSEMTNTPYMMGEIRKAKSKDVMEILEHFDAVTEREKNQYQLIQFLANENLSAADSLLKIKSLDINHWQLAGNTCPLFAALANKKHQSLTWLISNHVDLNITSPDVGYTSLMVAVYVGDDHAIEVLLSNGVNNKLTRNMEGKTALDIAKELNNQSAISILNR